MWLALGCYPLFIESNVPLHRKSQKSQLLWGFVSLNKYNSSLNYIGSPNKYPVWEVITIVSTENIGDYV